jgi:hypothetical protein
MEEAPENGNESSHSAHADGMEGSKQRLGPTQFLIQRAMLALSRVGSNRRSMKLTTPI